MSDSVTIVGFTEEEKEYHRQKTIKDMEEYQESLITQRLHEATLGSPTDPSEKGESSNGEDESKEKDPKEADPGFTLKKLPEALVDKKPKQCDNCHKYKCRYRRNHSLIFCGKVKNIIKICCLCKYLIIPLDVASGGYIPRKDINGITAGVYLTFIKDARFCSSCIHNIRATHPKVKVV